MTVINLKNFNLNDISLNEPKTEQIKNEEGKITGTYQRIQIKDLLIETPELISFGLKVSENDGVSTISFILWNKDKETGFYCPTKEQLEFTNNLSKLGEELKSRVIQFHEEKKLLPSLSKYKSIDHLINTCPFYWGKEKFEAEEVIGKKGYFYNCPTLYVKLIESKKTGKNYTRFSDYFGNEMDISEVGNNVMNCYAAISYDSIFVNGSIIKIQLKLKEVQIKHRNKTLQRILPIRQEQELLIEETDDEYFDRKSRNGSF